MNVMLWSVIAFIWLASGVISVILANESWDRRYPTIQKEWIDHTVWVMAIFGPISMITAWLSFRVVFGDKKFGCVVARKATARRRRQKNNRQ